jgi:hypothetical protein
MKHIFQADLYSPRPQNRFTTLFPTFNILCHAKLRMNFQAIFYNEPFWDMSKNGGLQTFVKMDLKCSTYVPEHKTERFRSIEVIVNFWELVEVGKIGIF